jgi:DNA-binding transcriptional LysR family regulator
MFDARVLGGIGVLAAVVEAGSFVRAAASLGITQSGVSRAIARLEERVGVRLLQRSARALTLTDDGRRFYEQVAPLLTGIENAASEAGSASAKVKGKLRIAIDPLVARTLVAPRIADFLAAHAEATVEILVRDQLDDLVASGIDVAVRFGEPASSSLIGRKLLETRVLTCASSAYLQRRGVPRHPRDLARHECILFRDPSTGRPYEWVFMRAGKTAPVKVSGRLTVNDSATQLTVCLAGHGIAQPLEVELPPGSPLVRLFPEWSEERIPLYAYYPSRRQPPAKVNAFIAFLAEA